MKKPKVCVLRTAGTNCDMETAYAFLKAGAVPARVHVNRLIDRSERLEKYHILAIPGGFSYGDDLGAGKVLANELKYKLFDQVRNFIREGKLIIGICNGFQVLVKTGLLPGNASLRQDTSLIINDSGKFEDRWVYLKQPAEGRRKPGKCVWTRDLAEVIYLPVAHGEGKFITLDSAVLEGLKESGQVVFQYCSARGALGGYPQNPNGSSDNIAGICDPTGRILGLMPHPERHVEGLQHPDWTAGKKEKQGDGFFIFRNGVEYAKKNM